MRENINAHEGFELEGLSNSGSAEQLKLTHGWNGNDFLSSQGLDRLYSTESLR